MLKLFILVDNFLACWVISLVGLIGMMNAFYAAQVYYSDFFTTAFIIMADFFFGIGMYRVLFKYARWRNWQIILTKIFLVAMMALSIDLVGKMILSR